MNRKYHLTFDIDWAPDFAIGQTLELLDKANKKATFFVTHQCDILDDIRAQGHNLGIHPNFLPETVNASSYDSIVTSLLEVVPDATMMRTHGLFQSSPMFYKIFGKYSQLKLDMSLYMEDFPLIKRFKWQYNGVEFDRINYNWEDDMMFTNDHIDWRFKGLVHPLTIFDFHPVHVALNSSAHSPYRSLISELGDTKLPSCSEAMLNNFISQTPGTKNFLQALLMSDYHAIDIQDVT